MRDIAHEDILHNVKPVRILANTTDGDTLAVAEDAVLNEYVCRVGLGSNTVISVLDLPPPKDDVVGEERVGSVGIARGFRVGAFGFDVDVFED
jgi:hypothetical protein